MERRVLLFEVSCKRAYARQKTDDIGGRVCWSIEVSSTLRDAGEANVAIDCDWRKTLILSA